jgi:hypothetical protein
MSHKSSLESPLARDGFNLVDEPVVCEGRQGPVVSVQGD